MLQDLEAQAIAATIFMGYLILGCVVGAIFVWVLTRGE